ncbi:MAG: hypothetical protein CMB80_25685 [Flammeovirgaceae bacterium]|nr:hypothetical protein [Flammeovirgaceae bacterium]|tara:strand:- start:5894 stop:7774 length:1881 start_codon:yes stop_codon:yes gene_type:complete
MVILNHTMMNRLLTIIFCIGIVHVSSGQLANTAYVGSAGGGISAGGSYSNISSIGDPAATADLASSADVATYPGFIPGNFIVLSFGLAKDSAVLAVLYEALAGDEWVNNNGWLQSSDISSWNGVFIENQRVVGLSLPSNNLKNSVPDIIVNLAKLDSINFQDNSINKIPDLTSMPSLTKLNVAENRLGFASLLLNTAIAEYDYSPQKRIGLEARNDTVRADSSFVLTAEVSGVGNTYQWIFDDLPEPEEAVIIEGATTNSLALSNLNYDNMGSYRLRATNDALPGLVLETRNQNIWASTDVAGTVVADGAGTLLTDGQVEIYRIYDGPFEKSDSAQLDSQGNYEIKDVVLGDFILLVKQNPVTFPDVIQTYYISTQFWQQADTLLLREAASAIDIQMEFKPEPPVQNELAATFEGSVETDLPDDTDDNLRVNARRKVKRAACSIRRFVPKGRENQDEEGTYELYAYVESDDDGNFTFTDIEPGTYRLNIEYPGVPMDEDSDIEIVVSDTEESQLYQISATITEDGIVVKTDKVLWTPKPFLKNVVLYPNPTAGVMAAQFQVYRKIDDLFAVVRDLKGSVLISQELDPTMGYHNTSFDLTQFESGVYFLEFSDGSGTFKQQVKISKK